MFVGSTVNMFQTTHYLMYRYLPVSYESTMKVKDFGVAALFFCRLKEVCSECRNTTYV